MFPHAPPRRALALGFVATLMVSALAAPTLAGPLDTAPGGVDATGPCPGGAPSRVFAVTALPMPVSYNRWGDMDLRGQLFVLDSEVRPLVDEVAPKLANAGLGGVAENLTALRDALLDGDASRAHQAALAAVAAADDARPGRPMRARVDVSELQRPLVLRANVGDCVGIRLLNLLAEPASLHVHGVVAPAGAGAAVGVQPYDLAPPGGLRQYQMYIPNVPGAEGAHFLHSHADTREQTRRGLFGALVAEPAGARSLSTQDGATEIQSGLEAIVVLRDGSSFREFVQIYHDEMELVNWQLVPLPPISPFGEYGPGTKGINLRSEPFMSRFLDHDARFPAEVSRKHDKSQSYGSYTYGDPGTVIQKSYLGDPVKFRLINAGPGQHHIHHLHGGGIRWRATPLAEDTQFDIGLTKVNPVEVAKSQRLDVQNVGPGESFNLEPEGGSGGVQQSVGDFLYHCHIAEHYLAGMWGMWRVYNTAQPGLAQLPDRVRRGDALPEPVDSKGLMNRTLRNGVTLAPADVDAWVRAQLPAQGVPGEEDASVWDWTVNESGIYVGEPETAVEWPNYPPDAPGRLEAGARPPILFSPTTGKLAYPLLRPHFGERPPFAPGHGPAPFLAGNATASNPDGLCVPGSRHRQYDLVAVQATVPYNRFDSDAAGQVFVRAEDRRALELTNGTPTSLVLRANAGDCVDVTLTSVLDEKGEWPDGIHTKTNVHIHLVQFDVQGSDGVVAGFNYETSVRSLDGMSDGKSDEFSPDPSAQVVARIAAGGVTPLGGGEHRVKVDTSRPFRDANGADKVGSSVGLSLGRPEIQTAKLVRVEDATTIVVRDEPGRPPLDASRHREDEFIGYEFVRYRWYPDVELGVVYFHDHVNGIDTWRRGLFGSLVVEPRDSSWLRPDRAPGDLTDDPTGHVVDVVRDGESFREIVLHFQDRACVKPAGGECFVDRSRPEMPDPSLEPASFNLRSEPLHRRDPDAPFWNEGRWSADAPGERQDDPSTTILRAYPGDRTVVRLVYTGQSMSRGVATFGVTGHRFAAEQHLEGSRTTDTMSAAVSSHHNFELEGGAGGTRRLPGDYLYMMTQPEFLQRGAWGLLRVYEPGGPPPGDAPLARLPSNPAPTVLGIPEAPVRRYDVVALDSTVFHNPTLGIVAPTKRFEMRERAEDVALAPPDPLVLRAAAGEIVEVTLDNRLGERVGLHAGLLAAGPADQGIDVGRGPRSTVGPQDPPRTYRWYADRELGVADLVSYADPLDHAIEGLAGALVVEPAGATFDPATGAASRITIPGRGVVREHVLLFTSGDGQFASSTMPYLPDVRTEGPRDRTLVNYATEPLARRMGSPGVPLPPLDVPELGLETDLGGERVGGSGLHTCQVEPQFCLNAPAGVRSPAMAFATSGAAPWTPIVQAVRGEPVVIRALGSAGDQLAVLHLDGHLFAADPEMDDCRRRLDTCRSNLVSDVTLGAREGRNVWIPAAGPGGAGDYLYRNHRDAYFETGAWGLMRVTQPRPINVG